MTRRNTKNGGVAPNRNDSFPRSNSWPDVSPTFYALNKDRYLRQLLIRDIETLTGRRLIVYFCNPDERPALNHQDIEGVKELLIDLNPGEEFDFLIESPGGDSDAADTIISILSNHAKFRAVVPSAAKSNATLICLAAEEILMGPSSEIGPIDPRIGPQQVPATFWAQDKFEKHADPNIQIKHAAAKDAQKHTEILATSILRDGMMEGKEEPKIKETVDILCAYDGDKLGNGQQRQFYSHGATINAAKALSLGLKINKLDARDQLWEMLGFLTSIYIQDCRIHRYSRVFEGRRLSNQIGIAKSTSSERD